MTRIPPEHQRIRYPWIASLIALVAVALASAGCGVDSGGASQTATTAASDTAVASPTPWGPTATPTPDLTVLLKDGGIAIIEKAYNRLLDQYIEPLEPSRLLAEAWAGMTQEARALGVAPPAQPSFGGDRVAAFEAFRAAYVPLANSVPDATKLRYGAIRQMANSLQDCHTFFLNPVAHETLVDTRDGKGSVGIGVELASVPPLVTEVITGGPAAAAGVLVGDRIIGIDGADATNLGPAGAYDLINGDEGTSVSLRLRRPGAAAPIEVTMTRARVNPPNVDFRIIEDRIGYVRVRNFVNGGIRKDLENVLGDFERRGLTGWIIDMRGNPGGFLDLDAISLFVRDGVIVSARGRGGEVEEFRASGKALPQLRPAVVLANHQTGSVAEVFVAALQEYGVARVIGATTNGCAGYTDVQDLGDGSSLAVTTHVNIGPVSGRVLAGAGVIPDQAVARTESDISNARDPQLDAAVGHLLGR